MTAASAMADVRTLLRHRMVGARRLAGQGLEIGALHYPLDVPAGCTVEYLDVDEADTLRRHFPELPADSLVTPTHRGDVVRASVPAITGRTWDFIVLNHVLEHVANPIQAIANVWAGVRDGGFLVLSVPDKHFTYDRARPLTAFSHCLADWFRGVTEVEADHYVDFLAATSPEAWRDRERFTAALARAVERREHAHVWDSASFRAFWDGTVSLLGLDAGVVFESTAAANHFEYFAVVRRAPARVADEDALGLLAGVFATRADLARAIPVEHPRFAERLLAWAVGAGATIDSAATTLARSMPAYRRLLARASAGDDALERTLRDLVGDRR